MRKGLLLAGVAALTLAGAAGTWWWASAPATPPPGYTILTQVDLSRLSLALHDGDLVFRRGTGRVSRYAANAGGGYFSHVGLLLPGDGGWRVMHTEADEHTGVGGVRNDTLEHFLAEAQGVAVVRLRMSDEQLQAIAALAADAHWQSIPFDAAFTLDDDGAAMYCTEWVQALVLAATGEDIARPRSLWFGREVISIEDLLQSPRVQPVLEHRLPGDPY
ncbi:YiiX/YebB-like N1pC/P60 family cysteine hydrolase [Arenimonas composti]|uniref:Permuted papain-like amidase YaeF/Yiix C92 family enzyme n=1 Tax=Arenimonas composti TR7-09 = DSM 18010 TaxID=1121013 RepID=A0A091BKV1_9GAMM|nr:YiiX/YebB-like N1pC/P60 family cysteine hydrolase [Arenimonas composti]KFN51419.1 hypothetical protein P873_02830 [Arenimonas composti TR7-09 = DSM 18010]